MESVVIETMGCPLDPVALQSYDHFSLENSYSYTSSHNSESADDESEEEHDDLLQQLKNLSILEFPDSKKITSKCSNKISEINSEVNKDIERNRSSSSSLKNKELLEFVVEDEVESTIHECSNKNCEIDSKKKIEKLHFVEDLENVESRFSSLSLKNNELLNKYQKSGSDISAGDESDSDNDEQGESVPLRDRDPTRHNRLENNKQMRTTPFPQNRTKTSNSRLNSNNSQSFGNFSPTHNYINHINRADFERYGNVSPTSRTFHSGFSTLGSVTEEDFETIVSSLLADQIYNNDIPSAEENKIVNGCVPCKVAAETVEGVIHYTVDEDVSVVPSADVNASYKFSEERNDTQHFDPSKERIISDSAITSLETETSLDSSFEFLPAEEVDYFFKNITNSKSDSFSNQNQLIAESPLHIVSIKEAGKVYNNPSTLNQNTCVESTDKEISFPNNNQRDFHPETENGHSSFSNANIREASFFSNVCEEKNILEKSAQIYNSKYLMNKPGNYSNMVCKRFTSINCESLSPKTFDYRIIANEIEHVIMKLKETKEPSCEINWNELVNNAISERMNTLAKKKSKKKKDSEIKNINQTSKSPCKSEITKIYWMLGTAARDKLFNSSSFCKRRWESENEKIRQQIKRGMLGTEEKKVIYVLNKNRRTKYRGTNLHQAILLENTEMVFCIVECHKECHDDINEINIRDSFNKTVLDYSKEKGMDLLSDYLEENTAKESINIE